MRERAQASVETAALTAVALALAIVLGLGVVRLGPALASTIAGAVSGAVASGTPTAPGLDGLERELLAAATGAGDSAPTLLDLRTHLLARLGARGRSGLRWRHPAGRRAGAGRRIHQLAVGRRRAPRRARQRRRMARGPLSHGHFRAGGQHHPRPCARVLAARARRRVLRRRDRAGSRGGRHRRSSRVADCRRSFCAASRARASSSSSALPPEAATAPPARNEHARSGLGRVRGAARARRAARCGADARPARAGARDSWRDRRRPFRCAGEARRPGGQRRRHRRRPGGARRRWHGDHAGRRPDRARTSPRRGCERTRSRARFSWPPP